MTGIISRRTDSAIGETDSVLMRRMDLIALGT